MKLDGRGITYDSAVNARKAERALFSLLKDEKIPIANHGITKFFLLLTAFRVIDHFGSLGAKEMTKNFILAWNVSEATKLSRLSKKKDCEIRVADASLRFKPDNLPVFLVRMVVELPKNGSTPSIIKVLWFDSVTNMCGEVYTDR